MVDTPEEGDSVDPVAPDDTSPEGDAGSAAQELEDEVGEPGAATSPGDDLRENLERERDLTPEEIAEGGRLSDILEMSEEETEDFIGRWREVEGSIEHLSPEDQQHFKQERLMALLREASEQRGPA